MDRKISWESGALLEIGLVYEKAEADPSIGELLEKLEDSALSEIRNNCSLLKTGQKKITPETVDGMSGPEKEDLICSLGALGISDMSLDIPNAGIGYKFSPCFPLVSGCTIFTVLNRLENLDGAFNEVVSDKAVLELLVPLGGRKGLFQWILLITKLYPWLSVREKSSNEAAVTALPPEKPEEISGQDPGNDSGKAGNSSTEPQEDDQTKLYYDYTNISVLIGSLKEAAESLQKISGYKNADELARKCREKIIRLQELTYQYAVNYMSSSAGKTGYEKALQLFRQIPDYRDAEDQARACERKIKELSSKKTISFRQVLTAALTILLIVLILMFLFENKNPKEGSQQKTPEIIKTVQIKTTATKVPEKPEQSDIFIETLTQYNRMVGTVSASLTQMNAAEYAVQTQTAEAELTPEIIKTPGPPEIQNGSAEAEPAMTVTGETVSYEE